MMKQSGAIEKFVFRHFKSVAACILAAFLVAIFYLR
jgi:hypothetical protein